MDIWDKKKRSDVMAKIRSKDTKPEWIVRRYLYSRGYRYRKNVKGLPGTPDIVLRKYGIVIFIHGCFWHGHEVDGHIPHSNVDFWRKKIERNKQRDEHNKEALKNGLESHDRVGMPTEICGSRENAFGGGVLD